MNTVNVKCQKKRKATDAVNVKCQKKQREENFDDESWLALLKKQTLPKDLRTVPLHDQFHAQASKTPSLIAVADDHVSLTYEQLNRYVLSLGEHLRGLGVTLDVPVGIYMDPSVSYVLGFMAAMSAGGCFLIIEDAYPIKMIQNVCADAKPAVILTTRDMVDRLSDISVKKVIVDIDGKGYNSIESLKSSNLDTLELEKRRLAAPRPTLDNLSFIVYSSGTTGKPKGIANPHRAPVLSYQWRWGLAPCHEKDRVACNVFFIWEAIRPLLKGAATYCIKSSQIYDAKMVGDFVEKHAITEMLFTPTLFQNLIATLPLQQIRSKLLTLKTCWLNGEVVSKDLARKAINALPNVRFINIYSISECHEVGAVDLSELKLDINTSKFCPVGKPSVLTPSYILDADKKIVKKGDAGELYVGGPLLAREYLNMPEETAVRFPENPFVIGTKSRMYRTGDRARILPDGMLEVLGRCAFMVKIRGYSVVLGAIEQALMDNVDIAACSVVADGEEGTEKRLVAFLVRHPTQSVSDMDSDRLSTFSINQSTGLCPMIQKMLSNKLPHYMVPSVYIEVKSLSLHPVSGKLDVKKLQEIAKHQRLKMHQGIKGSGNGYQSLLTKKRLDGMKNMYKCMSISKNASIETVEHVLLSIWEDILKLPLGSVSREDGFIALGGHSLSAARLIVTIEQIFNIRLPVVDVLQGINAKNQALAITKGWYSQDQKSSDTTGASELSKKVLKASAAPSYASLTKLPSSDKFCSFDKCNQVFFTGATGYLGAFLLAEMLMTGFKCIVCLVQKRKEFSAIERVKKNLSRYNILRKLGSSINCVVAIEGDITKSCFGVSSDDYKNVLMASDGIVHCAAVVSLSASFDTLKPANIDGTREIVQLAMNIKKNRKICPASIFISTNGIFPLERVNKDTVPQKSNCSFDDLLSKMIRGQQGSNSDNISEFCTGYGLTKWGAERIVRQGQKELGLPFVIYRLGNLGWHSKSGFFNELDFQCMIFRGCYRLGVAPILPDWRVELTPVDWAASTIINGASDKLNLEKGKVFHLVQPKQIPWPKVVSWINEVRKEDKLCPLKQVQWKEWHKLVRNEAHKSIEGEKLLALIENLPGNCVEYLYRQPLLQCDVECQIHKEEDYLSSTSLKCFFSRIKNQKFVIEPKIVGLNNDPVSITKQTLNGKVAIVTGSSSGIGRAIAVALAQAGCDVALAARRKEELEISRKHIASACTKKSVRTICVPTDVTDKDAVINLVKTTEESLGPVDIIVNNAGIMYFTLMKNTQWDQWDQMVDVNCKGVMHGIGAVLPQMVTRGIGHIINITSDAGRKAFAGLGVYSGSKFFVEAMSQALRVETANTGIRITCIQPGNVETPLLSHSTDPEGLEQYGKPSGAKVLEPADIGRAVVYAASQPEWCAINEILVEPREEPA